MKGDTTPAASCRPALTLTTTSTVVAATGVIHIHLIDFLKQMLTMRVRPAHGPFTTLRNLADFGRFFTTGVLAAYVSP